MKRAILTILISILGADAHAQTAAAPEGIGARPDDIFRFYDVRGTTAAELRAEIARLGPLSDGARHQAATNWRITWQVVTSASGGRCAVSEINVSLTTEVVLPRWLNEPAARQALSMDWRDYLSDLLKHEHGHIDIAREGAEEVRRLAGTATPQATCDAAADRINSAGRVIVDRTRARQRRYDQDTNHGRGQGVRLP